MCTLFRSSCAYEHIRNLIRQSQWKCRLSAHKHTLSADCERLQLKNHTLFEVWLLIHAMVQLLWNNENGTAAQYSYRFNVWMWVPMWVAWCFNLWSEFFVAQSMLKADQHRKVNVKIKISETNEEAQIYWIGQSITVRSDWLIFFCIFCLFLMGIHTLCVQRRKKYK